MILSTTVKKETVNKNQKGLNTHSSKIILDYTIIPMFNLIYSLIFLVFTLRLLVFHSVLIIFNLTTKDEMNINKMFIVNPYRKSDIRKNIKDALCPLLRSVSFLEMNDNECNETILISVNL
jgi:hypothetical protein